MNRLPQTIVRLGLISLAAMTLFSSTIRGQEAKPEETTSRQFSAEAKMYSFHPSEGFKTYRSLGGSGTVAPGGTLTLGPATSSVISKSASRLASRLNVFWQRLPSSRAQDDTQTKAQKIEYDLSDLAPRILEIARDDDGRVYRLSLVPSIREKPLPVQFNAADLQLDHWTFPSSPVLLNDQDYIGRLGMGRGPLAWCDIPGLAKVEFSLLHLKGALPLGTLENGVITIKHESGTTLQISDVKNGTNQDVLSGGPYRVWVRWKKPSQSIEEYRESLKRQIASLRERIKNGDLSLPEGTLERLEKMSESGRIGLIGNGIRGVETSELVTPGE